MNLEKGRVVLSAYQDQEPEPLTQTSAEGGAVVPPIDIASGLGGGGSDEGHPSGSASEGNQSGGPRRFWEVYGTGADGGPTLEEIYAQPRRRNPIARLFHRRQKNPVDMLTEKSAKRAGIR